MLLNQKQAQSILKKYSLSFPETRIFHDIGEITDTKITSQCVLKVDSPDAIHKTELGLVFTGINTLDDLKQKLAEAKAILDEKKITGYNFVLQESIKGTELLIGMKTDATFGKVIVFGIGGIFVELFKDVSMRIAPLERKDCLDMLDEIKSKKILDGFRKFPPVNKEKLVDVLMKISKIAVNEKDISEIDFNPVIANEKEAYIVDARMISDKDA